MKKVIGIIALLMGVTYGASAAVVASGSLYATGPNSYSCSATGQICYTIDDNRHFIGYGPNGDVLLEGTVAGAIVKETGEELEPDELPAVYDGSLYEILLED